MRIPERSRNRDFEVPGKLRRLRITDLDSNLLFHHEHVADIVLESGLIESRFLGLGRAVCRKQKQGRYRTGQRSEHMASIVLETAGAPVRARRQQVRPLAVRDSVSRHKHKDPIQNAQAVPGLFRTLMDSEIRIFPKL